MENLILSNEKKLKAFIFILLLGITICTVYFLINRNRYETFEREEIGFSIEAPKTWTIREFNGGFYRGRVDAYLTIGNSFFSSSSFVIVFKKEFSDVNLGAVDEWSREVILRENGVTPSPIVENDCFFHPQFRVFEREYQSNNSMSKHLYFVGENEIYLLDITVFDNDKENIVQLERIVNSFEITTQNNSEKKDCYFDLVNLNF